MHAAAAPYISQIKVVAPRVALKVIDESVQMFGGAGDQPGYAAGAGLDLAAARCALLMVLTRCIAGKLLAQNCVNTPSAQSDPGCQDV